MKKKIYYKVVNKYVEVLTVEPIESRDRARFIKKHKINPSNWKIVKVVEEVIS